MTVPAISILIPTLDGAEDLPRLLAGLRAQEGAGEVEIVAVDSSSRDGTVELLRSAGARVTVIEKADFGHGRTRNVLAEMARGELLVFMSQDAWPRDPGFLRAMADALRDHPGAAGATARVLAPPGVDALTRRTVDEAGEASAEPREARLPEGARFDDLVPRDAVRLARFNNVASCVRREVMERHPIPEVPFGEDMAWARVVLEAGYSLLHVPEAVALHAHRYGPGAAYSRYRTDAEALREQYGLVVRPHLGSVLKGVGHELLQDLRHAFRGHLEPLSLLRAPFLRTAQVMGQYAGSRGAPRGGVHDA